MNTILPEWAGQYHSDRLHILYGGFNPAWAAGGLERETADQLGKIFLNKFPDNSIHIVIPSWYETAAIQQHIIDVGADIVVLCSLSDPLNRSPMFSHYIQAGYTELGYQYDFWAVACLKFFKSYTEEDIQPTSFKHLFLNYNRKPHPHRVELVNTIEQSKIFNLGCITLEGKYTVNDRPKDFVDFGARDSVGNESIPNDIYSLGRLDIWNSSFINVVSETVGPTSPIFLSEKIYKPIIGMRPFIINGSIKIYRWLKDAGFDCFEDIFPVQDLIINPDKASSIIVDAVAKYQHTDLLELYNTLLPRLKNNRKRFFEYATDQCRTTHNI